MPPVTVSIIIPALSEAANLARAVESAWNEGADEVIVVDGGSNDDTHSIAASTHATLLTVSPAQRARQMNAGAAVAACEVLVFLHADTILTQGSLNKLRETAGDCRIIGGGFRRRYQASSLLLSTSGFIGNERAKRLGWFFGDQAIWVQKSVFEELGGFPERQLFEDLDFTRKLRRVGATRLINPGVETSARRFDNGILSRICKDFLLTVHHVCLDPSP